MDTKSENIAEFGIEEVLEYATYTLREDQIDFIASIKTPWHALGLQAAIENLYPQGSGLVIFTPHPRDGYLLSPEAFSSIGASLQFCRVSETDSASPPRLVARAVSTLLGFLVTRYKKSERQPIGIITPGHRFNPYARLFAKPPLIPQYYPEFVSIDTGLGAYFDVEQPTDASNEKQDSKQSTARRLYEATVEHAKDSHFSRVPLRDRSLFHKEDGTLVANEAIVRQYCSVLPEKRPEPNDIALIVTQPWSELGIIDRDTEMSVLEEAIESLQAEYNPVIRPHPREDPTKYDTLCHGSGATVEASDAPLEKELAQISPVLAVGFTSTALLTARVFYDIPAYSLVGQIPDSESDVKRFGEHFLNLAGNYVDPR